MYIYIYVYTHTHIYIYIYICVCVCVCVCMVNLKDEAMGISQVRRSLEAPSDQFIPMYIYIHHSIYVYEQNKCGGVKRTLPTSSYLYI